MDCQFTEKISLLIDGELSEMEAKETRAHLATCDDCQRAQEDFLSLRGAIRAYAPTPNLAASQERALRRILGSEKPVLWKRSVTLPTPVFALLLVALVALGIWGAFTQRATRAPAGTDARPGRVLSAPATDSRGGIDLARFDHGERALLYKVRRTNPGDVEQ